MSYSFVTTTMEKCLAITQVRIKTKELISYPVALLCEDGFIVFVPVGFPGESARYVRGHEVAIVKIGLVDREVGAVCRAVLVVKGTGGNAVVVIEVTALPDQLAAGTASTALSAAFCQAFFYVS